MPSYLLHLEALLDILQLRPTDGKTSRVLEQAARWVLNDPAYTLGTCSPVVLQPILGTLKGETTSFFITPGKLQIDLPYLIREKPDVTAYFKEAKQAMDSCPPDKLLTCAEIWLSNLAVSDKYSDLSLFDFVKLTVGVAEALERGNGKLRLAGGNISGIQTYLYEIISKNAAKLLKGRSFYIQLLAESVLDEIVSAYDLSHCQVIYSSGGGFYLLLPHEDDSVTKFETITRYLREAIYKQHKTDLFLEFAITDAFGPSQPIDEIWDELFAGLGKSKFQRLSNNPALLDDFFRPVEFGGTRVKDQVTNVEIPDGERPEQLADGTQVSKLTKYQIKLGSDLRTAKYWVTSNEAIGNKGNTVVDPFGKYHYLLDQLPGKLPPEAKILAINEVESGYPPFFYGGNSFPVFAQDVVDDGIVRHREGDIKPFDELVGNGKFQRLAILRMDVDDLGAIFSEKIADYKVYSLNWIRYMTLSRALDQFFKGYLNILQKKVEESIGEPDTSVIIYSGGDDLFLAGRWNTVLTLAEAIHSAFKAWSCNNLTLSGGIQLLPAKFPIMQGARMTADAEKSAKSHLTANKLAKNAITLFGKPLHWEEEFRIVREVKDQMERFLRSHWISKAFVDKINIHATAQQMYLKEKGEIPPRWRWTMAYDMSRYRDITKQPDGKKFVSEMASSCFVEQYAGRPLQSKHTFLQLLQLAGRWAEATYRSEISDYEE